MPNRQTIYRIIGPRRSGNHAVLKWILANLGTQDYLFLNELTPGQPPEKSYTELEYQGRHFGLDQRRSPEAIELAQKAKQVPVLILSYEDKDPYKAVDGSVLSYGYDKSVSYNLFLLRDFLNWLASYHQLQTRNLGHENWRLVRASKIFEATAMWCRGAILSADPRAAARKSCVFINYDKWFATEEYRLEVLGSLDLKPLQTTLPEVARYGGGSSFQATAQASELKPSERWQKFKNDEHFQFLLSVVLKDIWIDETVSQYQPETRALIRTAFGL